MSKDDTSYVPLKIEAPPSTMYYIHVAMIDVLRENFSSVTPPMHLI